jgi:hypothetical protein
MDLFLSPDLIVGKHRFVQSTIISDNLGQIFSNVSKIRDGCGMGAILSYDRGRELEGVINLARWERRERNLVPQTNVDDGVGQVDFLDVVDDDFFL